MTINLVLAQIFRNSKELATRIHHHRNLHTSSQTAKSLTRWYREFWQPTKDSPPWSHVVQVGDPTLRVNCAAVPTEEITSKEIKYFIEHMREVLRANNCVGLAAPQIGVSLRIFVMEFSEKAVKAYSEEVNKARETELLPFTVFINPELKVIDFSKKTAMEACASVKGYSAEVTRHYEVEVKGFNENGETVEKKFRGWNARIAQHEMDHLNGQIYVDLMNTKTFTCTCWQAVNAKRGRISLPFYVK